jgi:contactin associated protein-like 2
MIRKIATSGRTRTRECVSEYIVQYSDDGESFRSFTDTDGEVQVKIN